MEMSLIDSERTLITSLHDLFAFVSSLGHDGFLGSIHDKIPSSIKKSNKEINYGFSFFSLVGGVTPNIKKEEFTGFKLKLLKSVTSLSAALWNSIKNELNEYNQYYLDFENVIAKSLCHKLDFFKTIFHVKIYLCNLEHSDIDTFTGGGDYLSLKDFNQEKRQEHQEDDEGILSTMRNISINIISKLEQLLYVRTRFKSELPTEEILLQNVFEFIPIFLNNVIESQVMHDNRDNKLNEYIVQIARDLRHFLDYNDDKYYNVIVLIYEQLIKVLDDKLEIFSIFRVKESLIIKKMMAKITQSNCSESQYLSTIKFMIAYSSYADGAQHLFEERVTLALVSAHCLQNLDNHEYYEIKERNSKHILWLWTLHLMRQLSSMLIHESEFTYPLINFITAFEDRILRVLQFKGYVDGKKQFKVFAIARLEEIEHIINLVSFTLINLDQWKANNQEQVERIINTLFSFTVNLFQSNVALTDCFNPISQFEKYISNLTGEEAPSKNFKDKSGNLVLEEKKSSGGYSNISQTDKKAMLNKVVTSLRTPMKGEMSASDFSMLEQDETTRRDYRTSSLGNYMANRYRPSGFILKIEIILTKIALMLLRSMHLIVKNEIKHGSRSNFIKELSYYHESNNETKLFLICTNIFDLIQFSLHCQRKWTENFDSVDKLNKVLNGASQSTDNLLESYVDVFDVLQISGATADLGLLLNMMLLKAGQLSKDTLYDRNFLEIADERLVDKIKVYAEECKLLSLDRDTLIKNKEPVNRKVFGKSSYKAHTHVKDVGKNQRTNSDVIIDKVNKEFRGTDQDRSRSPKFY